MEVLLCSFLLKYIALIRQKFKFFLTAQTELLKNKVEFAQEQIACLSLYNAKLHWMDNRSWTSNS